MPRSFTRDILNKDQPKPGDPPNIQSGSQRPSAIIPRRTGNSPVDGPRNVTQAIAPPVTSMSQAVSKKRSHAQANQTTVQSTGQTSLTSQQVPWATSLFNPSHTQPFIPQRYQSTTSYTQAPYQRTEQSTQAILLQQQQPMFAPVYQLSAPVSPQPPRFPNQPLHQSINQPSAGQQPYQSLQQSHSSLNQHVTQPINVPKQPINQAVDLTAGQTTNRPNNSSATQQNSRSVNQMMNRISRASLMTANSQSLNPVIVEIQSAETELIDVIAQANTQRDSLAVNQAMYQSVQKLVSLLVKVNDSTDQTNAQSINQTYQLLINQFPDLDSTLLRAIDRCSFGPSTDQPINQPVHPSPPRTIMIEQFARQARIAALKGCLVLAGIAAHQSVNQSSSSLPGSNNQPITWPRWLQSSPTTPAPLDTAFLKILGQSINQPIEQSTQPAHRSNALREVLSVIQPKQSTSQPDNQSSNQLINQIKEEQTAAIMLLLTTNKLQKSNQLITRSVNQSTPLMSLIANSPLINQMIDGLIGHSTRWGEELRRLEIQGSVRQLAALLVDSQVFNRDQSVSTEQVTPALINQSNWDCMIIKQLFTLVIEAIRMDTSKQNARGSVDQSTNQARMETFEKLIVCMTLLFPPLKNANDLLSRMNDNQSSDQSSYQVFTQACPLAIGELTAGFLLAVRTILDQSVSLSSNQPIKSVIWNSLIARTQSLSLFVCDQLRTINQSVNQSTTLLSMTSVSFKIVSDLVKDLFKQLPNQLIVQPDTQSNNAKPTNMTTVHVPFPRPMFVKPTSQSVDQSVNQSPECDSQALLLNILLTLTEAISTAVTVIDQSMNQSADTIDPSEFARFEEGVIAVLACHVLAYQRPKRNLTNQPINQPASQSDSSLTKQLLGELSIRGLFPLVSKLVSLRSVRVTALIAMFPALTASLKNSESIVCPLGKENIPQKGQQPVSQHINPVLNAALDTDLFYHCWQVIERLTTDETDSSGKSAAEAGRRFFALTLNKVCWFEPDPSVDQSVNQWQKRITDHLSGHSFMGMVSNLSSHSVERSSEQSTISDRFAIIISKCLIVVARNPDQTVNQPKDTEQDEADDARSKRGKKKAKTNEVNHRQTIATSISNWLNLQINNQSAKQSTKPRPNASSSQSLNLSDLTNNCLLHVLLLIVLLYQQKLMSLSNSQKDLIFNCLLERSIGLSQLKVKSPGLSYLCPDSLYAWVWSQSPIVPGVQAYHNFLFDSLMQLSIGHSTDQSSDKPSDADVDQVARAILRSPNALKAFARQWQQIVQHVRDVTQSNAQANRPAVKLPINEEINRLMLLSHRLVDMDGAFKMLAAGIHHSVFVYIESFLSSDPISQSTNQLAVLSLVRELLEASAGSHFQLSDQASKSVCQLALQVLQQSDNQPYRQSINQAINPSNNPSINRLLAARIISLLLEDDRSDESVQSVVQAISQDGSIKRSLLSLIHEGFFAPTHSRLTNKASARSTTQSNDRSNLSVQLASLSLLTSYSRARQRLTGDSIFVGSVTVIPMDDVFELLTHTCSQIRTEALKYFQVLIAGELIDCSMTTGEDADSDDMLNHRLHNQSNKQNRQSNNQTKSNAVGRMSDSDLQKQQLSIDHVYTLMMVINSSLLPHCPASESVAALRLLQSFFDIAHKQTHNNNKDHENDQSINQSINQSIYRSTDPAFFIAVVENPWLVMALETRLIELRRHPNDEISAQQGFALTCRFLVQVNSLSVQSVDQLNHPTIDNLSDCSIASLCMMDATLFDILIVHGLILGTRMAPLHCLTTMLDWVLIINELFLLEQSNNQTIEHLERHGAELLEDCQMLRECMEAFKERAVLLTCPSTDQELHQSIKQSNKQREHSQSSQTLFSQSDMSSQSNNQSNNQSNDQSNDQSNEHMLCLCHGTSAAHCADQIMTVIDHIFAISQLNGRDIIMVDD